MDFFDLLLLLVLLFPRVLRPNPMDDFFDAEAARAACFRFIFMLSFSLLYFNSATPIC
jgi:hypothetical protein